MPSVRGLLTEQQLSSGVPGRYWKWIWWYDGARTPSLGKLTFSLVRQYVDDMLTVSEADILHTMHFVWERLKLVIEPTGTLGLAALYRGRLDLRGKRIGVVLSGGNVDLVAALDLLRELPTE